MTPRRARRRDGPIDDRTNERTSVQTNTDTKEGGHTSILSESSSPPFSTLNTASVCRSMTNMLLPANTLNALSLSPASRPCVILNACACSAWHGLPLCIELFARSVIVFTDLRRTTADGWCESWRLVPSACNEEDSSMADSSRLIDH
jgi:hypothetical protein